MSALGEYYLSMAALNQAHAGMVAPLGRAQIGLQGSQAFLTNQQGRIVIPMARSQIAEQAARSGLYAAQARGVDAETLQTPYNAQSRRNLEGAQGDAYEQNAREKWRDTVPGQTVDPEGNPIGPKFPSPPDRLSPPSPLIRGQSGAGMPAPPPVIGQTPSAAPPPVIGQTPSAAPPLGVGQTVSPSQALGYQGAPGAGVQSPFKGSGGPYDYSATPHYAEGVSSVGPALTGAPMPASVSELPAQAPSPSALMSAPMPDISQPDPASFMADASGLPSPITVQQGAGGPITNYPSGYGMPPANNGGYVGPRNGPNSGGGDPSGYGPAARYGGYADSKGWSGPIGGPGGTDMASGRVQGRDYRGVDSGHYGNSASEIGRALNDLGYGDPSGGRNGDPAYQLELQNRGRQSDSYLDHVGTTTTGRDGARGEQEFDRAGRQFDKQIMRGADQQLRAQGRVPMSDAQMDAKVNRAMRGGDRVQHYEGYSDGTSQISAPGNGTVDTTNAKLANGEAVLNRGAAEHLGQPAIQALNAVGMLRMGMVPGSNTQAPQVKEANAAQTAGKTGAQGYAKGVSKAGSKKAAPAKDDKSAPKDAKSGGAKPSDTPPLDQIDPKMLAAAMQMGLMGQQGGGMPPPQGAPMGAPPQGAPMGMM